MFLNILSREEKLNFIDLLVRVVRIDGENRYFTVLNNSERNLIVKLPMAVPGLISRCKTSVFNLLPFTSEIIMANNTVNICIFKNERNC